MHCTEFGREISGVAYKSPDGGQYCVNCASTLPGQPSDSVPSHADLSADEKPAETESLWIPEVAQLIERDRASFAHLGRRLAARLLDAAICFFLLLAEGFTGRVLIALGAWTPPEVEPAVMWLAMGVGK